MDLGIEKKRIKNSDIKEIIQEKYPFLDNNDINDLLAIGTLKQVKNKEIIISAGTKSRILFFILKGTFRGYFLNKEREEMNIFLRQAPSFFGPTDSLFDDIPTKFNIEAILPATILIFDIDELEKLAFKNYAIFRLYIMETKSHIQNLVYRIESLIDKQPQERYEDLLKKNPKLFQAAFNKHIANFLGVTPVSLSRIMKRIKNNPIKKTDP